MRYEERGSVALGGTHLLCEAKNSMMVTLDTSSDS